jgi:uncharacterized membrane protein
MDNDNPATPPSAPQPVTNPMPPEPAPPADQTPPPSQPAQTVPEGEKIPSAFSLFKPSWEALKLNLSTFLLLLFIPIVGTIVLFAGSFGFLSTGHSSGSLSVGFAAAIIVLVIYELLLMPALVYAQVKSAQGQKVSVSEVLRGGRQYFWRFYGVAILSGLIILGGFILLIVPGLFMLKRYYLATYMLISDDLGVMEALRRSAEVSKRYAGAVWGLLGVTLLLALVGIVPIIGLLVSWVGTIAYYCAPAVRYEQLKALAGGQSPAVPAATV